MAAKKRNTKPVIVIVQSGFVLCGDMPPHTGRNIILNDAHVIRAWGTTQGIGQLALTGRTKDTVLDPCGYCEINPSQVLFTIDCVDRFWK